jgi:biotin operon repressor
MTDFNIALGLTSYSFQQALVLFNKLPGEVHKNPKRAMELYQMLPDIVFSINQIKPVVDEMKVGERMIQRYINELKDAGLVIDVSNNRYKKVNN